MIVNFKKPLRSGVRCQLRLLPSSFSFEPVKTRERKYGKIFLFVFFIFHFLFFFSFSTNNKGTDTNDRKILKQNNFSFFFSFSFFLLLPFFFLSFLFFTFLLLLFLFSIIIKEANKTNLKQYNFLSLFLFFFFFSCLGCMIVGRLYFFFNREPYTRSKEMRDCSTHLSPHRVPSARDLLSCWNIGFFKRTWFFFIRDCDGWIQVVQDRGCVRSNVETPVRLG